MKMATLGLHCLDVALSVSAQDLHSALIACYKVYCFHMLIFSE